MEIAVISFTDNGDYIANNISRNINCNTFYRAAVKKIGMDVIVEKYFRKNNCIIFISSTGIAVRAIASYINSKDKDPAVLVIDSKGKFVISLLSGHLGGANDMALKISSIIKAEPIITTATDNMRLIAPDIIAKKKGYIIDDLKQAKEISAMLVSLNKVAYLEDNLGIHNKIFKTPAGYINNIKEAKGAVIVTNKNKLDFNIPYLKLINKNIVLGIGCRKGILNEVMKQKIVDTLNEYNIDKRAIKFITTVEVKQNEEAILNLADTFKCPLKIVSLKNIKNIHNKYEGSDFVEKTIGVRAVAEPCVEISGAFRITSKLKLDGITLCIGVLTN